MRVTYNLEGTEKAENFLLEQCNYDEITGIVFYSWPSYYEIDSTLFTVAVWKVKLK